MADIARLAGVSVSTVSRARAPLRCPDRACRQPEVRGRGHVGHPAHPRQAWLFVPMLGVGIAWASIVGNPDIRLDDWSDIRPLAGETELMADAIVNPMSSSSLH